MPSTLFRPSLSALSALCSEEMTEQFAETTFGDVLNVLEVLGISQEEFIAKVQRNIAETRFIAGQYLEALYCEDWHALDVTEKWEIEMYVEDRIRSSVRFPKGTELYCRFNRHSFTLAEDLRWTDIAIKATNGWAFYRPEKVEAQS